MSKQDILRELSTAEKIVYLTLKEHGELNPIQIVSKTLLSAATVQIALSKLIIRGLVNKRKESRYVIYYIVDGKE